MFNYSNGFRGFTLPPEFSIESISMVKFLKRIFIWLPFSSIFKLKQEEKHDEKNKELSAMCVSYCHSINIWKSNAKHWGGVQIFLVVMHSKARLGWILLAAINLPCICLESNQSISIFDPSPIFNVSIQSSEFAAKIHERMNKMVQLSKFM